MFANKPTTTINLISLFLVLLFSQAVQAAPALPEFSAKYAVQGFGTKLAEAHYRLSYTDTGYKFTQNTELYGFARLFADDSVSILSLVDVTKDHLLLTKHRYIHNGSDENENEDINIKWNTANHKLKGDITGTVRGNSIHLTTDTEIWDILSFQIPLMIEANKNRKEYPYRAILKGEIKTYHFVLTSSKAIKFAGKNYQALQVVRTDPDKDRQLHIWLIPELHNIPVIVENYRDGKLHSRMQLETLQFNHDTAMKSADAGEDDF
jgi:hypothetical protein